MKSELIKVIVFNNGKKAFEGSLYEWFENNISGDFRDLMGLIELCMPLMNGEVKEVREKEYYTGEWIIRVVE